MCVLTSFLDQKQKSEFFKNGRLKKHGTVRVNLGRSLVRASDNPELAPNLQNSCEINFKFGLKQEHSPVWHKDQKTSILFLLTSSMIADGLGLIFNNTTLKFWEPGGHPSPH